MDTQTDSLCFPIETDRLWLRPFAADDFEDLCAFQTLPAVARHRYNEPRSREETRTLLDGWLANSGFAAADDKLILAMALKDRSRVIGQVGLTLRSVHSRQGEIGFLMHPEFHRRGLASEACLPLLDLGFRHLGLHRVYGRCDSRNTASARLMERLGLRREAELRENRFVKGEWTSELVFAVLAREWIQSAAGAD